MKAISKKTGRTIVVKEIFENIFYDVDGNSYLIEDFDFIDNNHWQEVRERAAIAAMQGTMTILGSRDRGAFREIVVDGYSGKEKTYPKEIAEFAVACADALIEQLKKLKR